MVCVREITQDLLPSVIPIEDIEPCQVDVVPDLDGVHYFMLSSHGLDRVDLSV